MTYSLNFRQQVFAYKAKKILTFEQASEYFDIDTRTLFRWQRSIEPCSTRNRPATKTDMQALAADIQESPDDYQWERASRFKVTQSVITKALKWLNISSKRNAARSQGQQRGSFSRPAKNSALWGSQGKRFFIWMKEALPKICNVHRVIINEAKDVIVNRIGRLGTRECYWRYH